MEKALISSKIPFNRQIQSGRPFWKNAGLPAQVYTKYCTKSFGSRAHWESLQCSPRNPSWIHREEMGKRGEEQGKVGKRGLSLIPQSTRPLRPVCDGGIDLPDLSVMVGSLRLQSSRPLRPVCDDLVPVEPAV